LLLRCVELLRHPQRWRYGQNDQECMQSYRDEGRLSPVLHGVWDSDRGAIRTALSSTFGRERDVSMSGASKRHSFDENAMVRDTRGCTWLKRSG
jgi:hypothetical protein